MFYGSFMKNLLKFFCLISSACFLLACAGTSDLGNEALESSQDSIIHVRKTITVSAGDVFDGKSGQALEIVRRPKACRRCFD